MTQQNQLQTQLLDLLAEIVKQNNAVIQQNSMLINQMTAVTNLNNELLLMLEEQELNEQSNYDSIDGG
ncbi:hypothetical protein G9F32_03055 [Acinetobacter sp. 194]|uniref:hypothetical protein n=1 Tax=Acinetobacter shaoyimingii TaxID=2715164 RepID=UPI0014099407|nr:hypothetical protein [Acinetobacter shaoyimingii]NHB57011.1 hypothetical protein [Acinetobacter shaoyimingii]